MSRVSVVLATHNGAAHLPAQLESILAQTRPPDELVVRDDASTDGTPALLADLAERAGFPVVVHRNRHRLGYAQNFARLLQDASGDVVALCDQDDLWEPAKLAVLTPLFDDASLDVVIHDLTAIGPNGRPLEDVGPFVGRPDFEFVKGCATVVRRSFATKVLPMPADVDHDEWLHTVAALVGTRRTVDEPLARYRVHAGNASGALPSARAVRVPSAVRRTRDAFGQTSAALGAAARRAEATMAVCSWLAEHDERPDVRRAAAAAVRTEAVRAAELRAWARMRERGPATAVAWRVWRKVGGRGGAFLADGR